MSINPLEAIVRDNRIIEYFKTALQILNGNANYRFAALLVRSGVLIMLGPSIFVLIVMRLFDVGLGTEKDTSSGLIAVGTFLVGVALIIVGVWHFRIGSVPTVFADALCITIAHGETFQSVIKKIVELEKKALSIEGFSEDELNREMSIGVIDGSKAVSVLEALRSKTINSTNFPEYSVFESDALIQVKRIP